jgi:hypothetical protein
MTEDQQAKTDETAVVMRVVKDQASPSQINLITSFCPAVFAAL